MAKPKKIKKFKKSEAVEAQIVKSSKPAPKATEKAATKLPKASVARVGGGIKKAVFMLNPLPLFKGLISFFRSAADELKTVTWLSGKDTVKFSLYILGFLVFSAITIALIDLGLFKLVTFITTKQ